MKIEHLIKLGAFGLSTILFRRKKAILGTIILTDKCNLHCKHCSVNNITTTIHPYTKIKQEMGFYIVNVVTNGTYELNLPEADLILLSLDGDKERINK